MEINHHYVPVKSLICLSFTGLSSQDCEKLLFINPIVSKSLICYFNRSPAKSPLPKPFFPFVVTCISFAKWQNISGPIGLLASLFLSLSLNFGAGLHPLEYKKSKIVVCYKNSVAHLMI